MKLQAQHKALQLRQKGYSIREIVRVLKVSKSSVSLWVRSVELSENHQSRLSLQNSAKTVVNQRRLTRLKNEDARRSVIVEQAKQKISRISLYELQLLGTVLYWAEGGGKNYKKSGAFL